MKIAFICGPYRSGTIHQIVQNIRTAEHYAKKYWKCGYAVICPHMNTALLDGYLPDDIWLNGAKELLKCADTIIAIPNWEFSFGSREEIELAKSLNKIIIYEK